jgi:hypothetical protein
MFSKLRNILLFFLLVTVQIHGQNLSFLTDSTHYLWPTDASNLLSSTFGETRSAHFHAGLDIRTWGREGYRVFATRDGVVHRIGISPNGYGKVIYLKHDDNSYSIYAHLHHFEPGLMALADSIRLQDYSFELDEIIEDKNIRFRQGDIIGYSGSTGVGPPHLHFELRTPEFEAFNPLYTNLKVLDTLPPVFSALGVEHLDSKSFHVMATESRRAQARGGAYHFGTIDTDGPIGLSVDTHDRANGTANVYAVYKLTVVHQSDTLFQSNADMFSYQDAPQMFIDRVFSYLKEESRGFQRLYVVNGNNLGFYKQAVNRGVISMPPGEYPIQIIAEDFFGNTTHSTVNIRFSDISQPVIASTVPAYPMLSSTSSGVPFGNFYGRNIFAPQFTDIDPVATFGPSAENGSQRFERGSESKTVRKRLLPHKAQTLHFPDQRIWIRFPEYALFDTLDLEVKAEIRDGLPYLTFSPEYIPLQKSAELNIILDDPGIKDLPHGIYNVNRFRDRNFFMNSKQSGGLIRARVSELHDFAVLKDTEPPTIGRPAIRKNIAGKYVVYIPVDDEQSKIDYRNSSVIVNNQKGITEFDPDNKRLIFYLPDFEPRLTNTIQVRVQDGVGNVTVKEFEIRR